MTSQQLRLADSFLWDFQSPRRVPRRCAWTDFRPPPKGGRWLTRSSRLWRRYLKKEMNRSSMAKDVGFTPTPGISTREGASAAVFLKFKRIGVEAWRCLRDRKLIIANINPSPFKEYCVFWALTFYLSPCVESEATCGIKVCILKCTDFKVEIERRLVSVDLSRAESMPDRSTRCGCYCSETDELELPPRSSLGGSKSHIVWKV